MNKATNRSNHITEDMCTDILHGLLDRKDADAILDHLWDCVTCEEMFRSHVAALENLKSRELPVKGNDGRWVLGAGSRNIDGVARGPRPGWMGLFKPRFAKRWALGFAAAVTIGLALVVLLPLQKSSGPPLPEYWIPSGREIRDLRSSNQLDANFGLGLEAYDNRELKRSIALLKSVPVEGPYHQLRNVYLASAMTLSNRYREALPILQELESQNLPQPWRNEIRWIHYIALEGDGRAAAATAKLGELVDLEGTIGDLARERMKALK